MTEATLKRALVKAIKDELQGAVVYRHEDAFSAGRPDISVTWEGVTSWWEVKYEPLGRTSRPTKLQAHEVERLGRQTVAGFVIYRDRVREGGKRAYVATWEQEESFPGYDHIGVANAIRGHHVIPRRNA